MPSPSQEHPAFSKSPSKVQKDIDILCTFKIMRENHSSKRWVYQRQLTISKS